MYSDTKPLVDDDEMRVLDAVKSNTVSITMRNDSVSHLLVRYSQHSHLLGVDPSIDEASAERNAPLAESKDATDELSDFKLSLSKDKDVGTTAVVLLVVTGTFELRFFGGKGGGDSSTEPLQRIPKTNYVRFDTAREYSLKNSTTNYPLGWGGFGGGLSTLS